MKSSDERVLLDLSAPVAEALDLPRRVPVRRSALDELRVTGGLDLDVLQRELEAACADDPTLISSLGHGLARLRHMGSTPARVPTPTVAPPTSAGQTPVADSSAPSRRLVPGLTVLLLLAGAGAGAWFLLDTGDDEPAVSPPPSTTASPSTIAPETTLGSTTVAPATTTTTTTTTTTIPRITVPSLLGRGQADAVAQLELLGLAVTVERLESYDTDPGIVLATEPTAAAELDPGGSVTVTVSVRPTECNDRPGDVVSATFGDIAGLGAEAAASIDWAVAVGLVSEGAAFGPADAMTRGAATTMLWRYMCRPLTQGLATPFTDVAAEAFYADAIGWASARGIVGGTSPTTFGPDEPISRAAFITIVWRALDQPTDDTALPFTDVDPAAFYTPAVQWAVGVGLVNGTTPTTFAPDEPLSRITTVILFDRIERNVDPLVG